MYRRNADGSRTIEFRVDFSRKFEHRDASLLYTLQLFRRTNLRIFQLLFAPRSRFPAIYVSPGTALGRGLRDEV